MYSPTPEEFLKLAAHGNLIPVTRRILADLETPLSAYWKIRGAGESFLFESVEGGEHIGRYSFVGCNPRATIKQAGNRVEVIENGRVTESFVVGQDIKDGLEIIERTMKGIGQWRSQRCRASPEEPSALSATNSSTTLNQSCPVRRMMNWPRR